MTGPVRRFHPRSISIASADGTQFRKTEIDSFTCEFGLSQVRSCIQQMLGGTYGKLVLGIYEGLTDAEYPELLSEAMLQQVIKSKPWKATRSGSYPNSVYKFCADLVPRLCQIFRALDIYRYEPPDWKVTETIVGRKPGKPDYPTLDAASAERTEEHPGTGDAANIVISGVVVKAGRGVVGREADFKGVGGSGACEGSRVVGDLSPVAQVSKRTKGNPGKRGGGPGSEESGIDEMPCPCCAGYMRATNTTRLESGLEKALEQTLTEEVEQNGRLWSLNSQHNILVHARPCLECIRFVAHLSLAIEGRRNNNDWAAWRLPHKIIRGDNDESSDEEDNSSLSSDNEQDGGDKVEEEEDDDEDYTRNDLAAHMHALLLLRSAKGRRETNPLFSTDPALLGRRQELIAGLLTSIADVRKEQDEALVHIGAMEQQIETARARRDEYNQQLQRIDIQYPHKRPTAESAVESTDDPMPDVVKTASGQLELDMQQIDPHFLEIAHRMAQTVITNSSQARTHPKPHKNFPEATQSAEQLSNWIQENKCSDIRGVPACGPDWIPELRDARGHQVMATLAGSTRHVRNGTKRAKRRQRFFAILRVLIVPFKYASTIQRISAPIAERPLSVVDFGPNADDDSVASILAHTGLTVAIADDTWQFCVKFVEAEIKSSTCVYDKDKLEDLLNIARTMAAANGGPPGF
ncbi:hypothetical protein DFH07DRAFT_785172 [Mycena maculata]|uniref:Uncharacterized protein n=1 Tax=Mycena maculata TaxID=230809 RepID=A0AAD7HCZ4_9AGAR|nr:hypothetical protein DFH07DRAFT_785172 [Mycena maculata]